MAEDAPAPRSPAPKIDPVFTWPTPNVTDLLFFVERNGDLPENKKWKYGDAWNGRQQFPNHKLVYVSPQTTDKWSRWYYAADRAQQDLYNFTWSSTDIGGSKFQSVTRTYLTLRDKFVAGKPEPGTEMPNVPAPMFKDYAEGAFVLASTRQVRAESELDSIFVMEERTYVRRCNITDLPFDDATGAVLTTTDTLYFGTEVVTGLLTAEALFADQDDAFWGVQATGEVVEGRQLSCDWYLITERQVAPPRAPVIINGAGELTAIPLRSYGSSANFMWPGILRASSDITFQAIPSKGGGYDRIFPRVDLSNPPYRGPSRILVEEYWRSSPLAASQMPTIQVLFPKEIEHTGANYSLNIEPTLHAATELIDTVGSGDPRFEEGNYSQTYPATDPTEWPEYLVIDADQQPFRGGYRITVTTAYRPANYVPPPT